MKRSVVWLAFLGMACMLALPPISAQAVVILDLTPVANTSLSQSANLGGTFVVANTAAQSTGTGVIDSFVRIHQTGEERGYNTSNWGGPQPPLDDVAGNFTHALQLNAVPIVTIGGLDYREFLLDVAQPSNGNISVNQIQLFQSSADVGTTFSLTEADATHDALISFPSATEIFRMNAGPPTAANYEVVIDSNHGNGAGDMFLYVRNNLFDNSQPNSYVTLFSQFGLPPGTFASAGSFEEWSVLKGAPNRAVPEPFSIAIWSLLGLGGAGLAAVRQRRKTAVRPQWSTEARSSIHDMIEQGRIH